MPAGAEADARWMGEALRLAERGRGLTSPNPMVGAILVRGGNALGRGWHHRAGNPHAEIEALEDCARRGHEARGATLYVTLEPCSTHGRTPPCTEAILAARIRRVVAATTDPNPAHQGRGLARLRSAGIKVERGVFEEEATRLNEAFNHWIVQGLPFVTVKSAMTLDGRIATATGESKWITSEASRKFAMQLRYQSEAILVGVNTVLADNPALTARLRSSGRERIVARQRVVLDTRARIPLACRLLQDAFRERTTVVVGRNAPSVRIRRIASRVRVLVAPERDGRVHLPWLLRQLGSENVTSLLVEGGGEVNASFLLERLAQRIAFFYAPKVMGGKSARRAVAGDGAGSLLQALSLQRMEWRRFGPDLYVTARVRQGTESRLQPASRT